MCYKNLYITLVESEKKNDSGRNPLVKGRFALGQIEYGIIGETGQVTELNPREFIASEMEIEIPENTLVVYLVQSVESQQKLKEKNPLILAGVTG